MIIHIKLELGSTIFRDMRLKPGSFLPFITDVCVTNENFKIFKQAFL